MTEPAFWYGWIKVLAFIAGLSVGAFAVYSPAAVWLRFQELTAAAASLAFVGCIMVGMSIWQSIQLEGPGFKLIMSDIEQIRNKLNDAVREQEENRNTLLSLRGLASIVTAERQTQFEEIKAELVRSGYTEEEADRITATVKSSVEDYKGWHSPIDKLESN